VRREGGAGNVEHGITLDDARFVDHREPPGATPNHASARGTIRPESPDAPHGDQHRKRSR
jgi:hypothetical protein